MMFELVHLGGFTAQLVGKSLKDLQGPPAPEQESVWNMAMCERKLKINADLFSRVIVV